jgi:enoyl-CoA hydratase/carnithine racemase
VAFSGPESATAMDDIVTAERDGSIATITLNRPAVLNALNLAVLDRLEQILAGFQTDAALRAVILTGTGERAAGSA